MSPYKQNEKQAENERYHELMFVIEAFRYLTKLEK